MTTKKGKDKDSTKRKSDSGSPSLSAAAADEMVQKHPLKKTHLSNATSCDVCKTKIWGIGKGAYKCLLCDLVVHKKCVEDIQNECPSAVTAAPTPKEDKTSPVPLIDERAMKFAEIVRGGLQQQLSNLSEKPLPRMISAPVKVATPKQPTRDDIKSNSLEPDPNAVPTFGSSLQDLMNYERSRGSLLPVPVIVSKSLKFLFECGLGVEGLFRVPGASQRMNAVIEKYNKGLGLVLDYKKEGCSEADVSSILKKYFRDLPEPLFTVELQDKFQSLGEIEDVEEKNQKFKEYFKLMPEVNRQVIKQFLFFLHMVSANSNINMMTTQNLATIFGTMAGVFFSFDNGAQLVAHLIDFYPDIFEADELAITKGPYFRKKLVGHTRSILRLIYAGNFIWSFDSSGVVRTWDPESMSFIKHYSSGQKFFSLPILVDQTIWIASPSGVLIFNINNPGPPIQTIKLQGCVCLTHVENCVWLGGQQLLVFDSKTYQSIEDLTDFKDEMVLAMDSVGKFVWTWRSKVCYLYDPQTRKKVHELPNLVTSKPAIFTEIDGNIWIGCEDGSILVLDPNTFQPKAQLKEHTGCVYHIIKIGNFVWSCSWDKRILCWDPQKFQFVGRLPTLHTDAVSWILPLWYEDRNAWQVWTASWDRSIHVWYVPRDYDIQGQFVAQDALQHFTTSIELATNLPSPSPPPPPQIPSVVSAPVINPQSEHPTTERPLPLTPLPDPSVPIPPPIAASPPLPRKISVENEKNDKEITSHASNVVDSVPPAHEKKNPSNFQLSKSYSSVTPQNPPNRVKAISQSTSKGPAHLHSHSAIVLEAPKKGVSSHRLSTEQRRSEGPLRSSLGSLTNTIETISREIRNLKKERDELEDTITENLKQMTVELDLNDFDTESPKYTAHKKQLEALHRQELQILQQIVDKQQELLRAKQLLRVHQVREEVEQKENASKC